MALTAPCAGGEGDDADQLARRTLADLPEDVLALVFEYLSASEIGRLRRVSRSMEIRARTIGIPRHLAKHAQQHTTLHPPASQWPRTDLFQYNAQIEGRIASQNLCAVQIGPAWPAKVIPTLLVTPERVVMGVGADLVVHPLVPYGGYGHDGERTERGERGVNGVSNWSMDGRASNGAAHCANSKSFSTSTSASTSTPALTSFPSASSTPHATRTYMGPKVVSPSHTYPLHRRAPGTGADIVGVHELPGGSLVVAQFDGTVQRLELELGVGGGQQGSRSTAHYAHPRENIHVMAGNGDLFLTGSKGRARVFKARSPWIPPTVLNLEPTARPWSALLTQTSNSSSSSNCSSSLGSSAFLGLLDGIRQYALRPTGLDSVPIRTLLGPEVRSAAYGLVHPSSRTDMQSTLLTAWHDGYVRLYDLRTPSNAPRLAMHNPWSDAGLYCATYVGAHGVAAGSAEHGVVSIWDLRAPRDGYAVYSPRGGASPVFALCGDGGRVWGVTQRRAFVFSFDGGGDMPGGIVLPKLSRSRGYSAVRESVLGYRHRGVNVSQSLFETRVPA